MNAPEIEFRTGSYPGWGSDRGYHWVRVTYQNLLLDEGRAAGEFDLGKVVASLEAKWLKRWTAAKFAKAIEGKGQASPTCDHCGGDTLEDGSSSCVDKTFCVNCQPFIASYIAAYHEEAARRREASEARQQEDEARHRLAVKEALEASFHWRDGWHFKRLPDGSVRIMHGASGERWLETDLTVPPNEWASIVASMSAVGETAENYHAVLAAQSPPAVH